MIRAQRIEVLAVFVAGIFMSGMLLALTTGAGRAVAVERASTWEETEPMPTDDIDGRIQSLMPGMVEWLKENGLTSAILPDGFMLISKEELVKATKQETAAGACINGYIYFDEALEYETLVEQSLILHELVHLAQGGCQIPKSRMELALAEHAAYQLQAQWYEQHGGAPKGVQWLKERSGAYFTGDAVAVNK